MRVESAPYGTLIAVYTTVVQRLYATKMYQNCNVSEVCGTVNSAIAVTAYGTAIHSIHGRHFPRLDFVFSVTTPMMSHQKCGRST